MATVFAVALVAGLLVTATALRTPPSRPHDGDRGGRGRPTDDDEPPEEVSDGLADEAVEWHPLTQAFLRQRLDALGQELERLDRDRDVFAKAFHLVVVRSAHEAVLADVTRLATRSGRCTARTLSVESVAPSAGSREELQL